MFLFLKQIQENKRLIPQQKQQVKGKSEMSKNYIGAKN
jgi:hypothetical protein